MLSSISRDAIASMRAVVGHDPPEIELIRALHLAKNDIAKAINCFFDSSFNAPSFVANKRRRPSPSSPVTASTSSLGAQPTALSAPPPGSPKSEENQSKKTSNGVSTVLSESKTIFQAPGSGASVTDGNSVANSSVDISLQTSIEKPLPLTSEDVSHADRNKEGKVKPVWPMKEKRLKSDSKRLEGDDCSAGEWLLLKEADVCATSTCKGEKLQAGEDITFIFPRQAAGKADSESRKRFWGNKSKGALNSGPEIVRFCTPGAGEIGRLPADYAKPLIPLVASGKVRIEGACLYSPQALKIMDTIFLRIRIYMSPTFFVSAKQKHLNSSFSLCETATVHPLSSLLRLCSLQPFLKAEFTPEDFFRKKRSLALDESMADKSPAPVLLPPNKRVKGPEEGDLQVIPVAGASVEEGEGDAEGLGEPGETGEAISDADVSKLVGTSDSDYLEEMESSEELTSELRPYQKQALGWMYRMETGAALENESQVLHPCWEAYHLADRNKTPFYHNVFSGEATLQFPSALQRARGGILADTMGLGKTVMTISLLVANKSRGGSALPHAGEEGGKGNEAGEDGRGKVGAAKFMRRKAKAAKGGGTLIVCPLTLLNQWQVEIEAHTRPGSLSVCAYYGPDRAKDRQALLKYDVVLTTYGVLASDLTKEDCLENGPAHSIHWYRVVLDEAHCIKALQSRTAAAVFQLTADSRWCLTGTPIQNRLEDLFSLLHFIGVEPWSNYGWWNKLIQKPYEEGDQRSLRLLQAILKPLMLRRTKESKDCSGKPILVLPPTDQKVIKCQMSVYERDFYDALFEKSKVKFNEFVEQGRVLHNYASILELLLRMRQCCDHPFLVLSRGDTADYSDLKKLAKRFLSVEKAGEEDGAGSDAPSAKYVKGVVEELAKGQTENCPFCLEPPTDAVFTPCAHRFCRECILTSWRPNTGGPCPICRRHFSKADLITAPSESRFQVDVEKNWRESCKVTALMECLEELRTSGEKGIVFSQWTSFLDLLAIPLKRKKFDYVRLDGTLSQQQRTKAIEEFRSRKDVHVMLISLKAGGIGINLTAASSVFLLDPWWNPGVEEQAIMRIHRIGQTRPVSIRRFIVSGTVEESMQAVQERKQRLVNGALTDEQVKTTRIEELKLLFR